MMLALPPNVPDVWGEGLLFGFSGLDGATETAGGFVATFAEHPYDLLLHTPRKRLLRVRTRGSCTVRAATGDVLAVAAPDGELALTWAAWHTLVGAVPPSAEVALAFADEQARPSDATVDAEHGDAVALVRRPGRVAVACGADAEQAVARANAALDADIEALVRERLAYLRELPSRGDPLSDRLLAKCVSVMKVNTLSPEGAIGHTWSTPDRVPHRHMWLWDSAFHSLAMNHVDPGVSREILHAVLDRAWTEADGQPERTGMISHMMTVDGSRSPITQPPLLAWAVLENVRASGDLAWAAEAVGALGAYLGWDLEHRDRNGNHLLEWTIEGSPRCRSGESGLDNSPRFDAAATLDAVDFSALVAHDARCLAALHRLLGSEAEAAGWDARAAEVEAALHALLWSEADGFYYDRTMDGELTGVKAVTGFFPLLLASLPPERVERLVATLRSEHFHTAFPVPSVAATDPEFSTDMWRGATWANTNYLVIRGLRLHGRHDEAARLRDLTIAHVQKHYEQQGALFEFYDAADRVPPTRCHRKGPLDGKPYLLGKVNSIRDYHWTAALTACLLLEA